ncbi:MAG TPA: nickel pincer cofactor biosynthesis protein LarC [Blastocatellia bacterium]|nr:nickel pincer cofactor biosynthesis protein LarC [Blastocatellia bacterium]
MRTLYFDCFAGASGDMIVGALIDLGVDPEQLKREIGNLGVSGYGIEVSRVKRSVLSATRFDVRVDSGAQPARKLNDIQDLIRRSSLSQWVREASLRVFGRLADAEAKVHGTTPAEVHFHEVGAVDSIVDIVGAMVGFDLLGIRRFASSPLRVGHGVVQTEHGQLPIPAPATAELLKGLPAYGGDREGEYTTPTGAAIVSTLSESFGPMPSIRIEQVGYGAGSRDPQGFPNVLRAVLGNVPEKSDALESTPESVIVIETNLDDMTPQAYESVMQRIFAAGALDCYLTPVQMKKNRPGVLLTVLAEPVRVDLIAHLLLTETTSFGVRYYETRRRVLERRVESIETVYGTVRVKVAVEGGRALHFQPEYDDCARLANQANVPFLEVQAAAIDAYKEKARKEEG